jgi:hypothetical protein
MADLESRFTGFIKSHPTAEWVDELTSPDAAASNPGEERADFFLENRTFVGELKSLETDTRYKIDEIIEPYRHRADWPQYYGTWPLEQVLRKLPDGEAIFRQVSRAVTSAIPGIVRKANRQIGATKRAIRTTSAEGILVVLNGEIELLPPLTISNHIRRVLTGRKKDGSPSFRHIQSAIVVSEAHQVVPGGDPKGLPPFHPLVTTINDLAPPTPKCSRITQELLVGWATFNGMPLVTLRGMTPPPVMPTSDVLAAQQPMSRSDQWRRDYRATRLLAALSQEELIARGRESMNRLTPHFIKDSGVRLSDADLLPLLKQFTEFLEEVNLRGLSLEEWGPSVGRDVRARYGMHGTGERQPE